MKNRPRCLDSKTTRSTRASATMKKRKKMRGKRNMSPPCERQDCGRRSGRGVGHGCSRSLLSAHGAVHVLRFESDFARGFVLGFFRKRPFAHVVGRAWSRRRRSQQNCSARTLV